MQSSTYSRQLPLGSRKRQIFAICSRGRIREYDPQVGRWLQKDPIGFGGGSTNLYGYVVNDPVNFVDPSGKNPVLIAIGVTGFIGGVTSAIGTASQGGTYYQIGQSFGVGFVGGAGAATIFILSGGSALAGFLGIVVDTGFTFVMAPTNLPPGMSLGDVGTGLQGITHPPACPSGDQ